MSRLSSAFCNIGNCGYKCLCVSFMCVTLLFYWKWVRLCQKGWCHLHLWAHNTQSVPWDTFIDKVLVLADTWRVALHVNLLCFAVTGSGILGNRPVGMEGEGTYKPRHADRRSWRASPLQQHRLNSSPGFWPELHRALPSRKESGLNWIWGEGCPLLQYFPVNKTCCHSCDLNDLYKCCITSKFQFHIWSHIWKSECCLYFKSTYKLLFCSVYQQQRSGVLINLSCTFHSS